MESVFHTPLQYLGVTEKPYNGTLFLSSLCLASIVVHTFD